jgi:ABC-type Fe3+/spermidine/putrescine transport system ATPase subunit
MRNLEVLNIHKSFDSTHALNGVSFELKPQEIIAVLGPSGCGKSTLLKIIAGLETADEGEIRWNEKRINHIPPYKRNFGLMFQDLALFPHKNVFENIAFGLRMSQKDKDKIQKRVNEVLSLVGLPNFGKRDVHSLSGGEAQRVALARSLAPNPQLLMLDEPLGSLDRNLRERLVIELKDILQQSQQTAIYVTHDQMEAFVLANRIVVLNEGRIEQFDTPENIYLFPSSVFVAKFLGLENILPGTIIKDGKHYLAITPLGRIPIHQKTTGEKFILIRSDYKIFDEEGEFQLSGIIKKKEFQGNFSKISIDINGYLLKFTFPTSLKIPQTGETIRIHLDTRKAIQLLDR